MEKDMEELKEAVMELIMRTQGSGYLKVPSKVRNEIREKHEKEIKDLTTPNLFYKFEDSKLKLIYEFDLDKEYKGEYAKDEYV